MAGKESDLIEQIISLREELRLSEDRVADCVDDLDSNQVAESQRAVIEQAKGMLMGRTDDLSADEALVLLVAASQRQDARVEDIARKMVDRRSVVEE